MWRHGWRAGYALTTRSINSQKQQLQQKAAQTLRRSMGGREVGIPWGRSTRDSSVTVWNQHKDPQHQHHLGVCYKCRFSGLPIMICILPKLPRQFVGTFEKHWSKQKHLGHQKKGERGREGKRRRKEDIYSLGMAVRMRTEKRHQCLWVAWVAFESRVCRGK